MVCEERNEFASSERVEGEQEDVSQGLVVVGVAAGETVMVETVIKAVEIVVMIMVFNNDRYVFLDVDWLRIRHWYWLRHWVRFGHWHCDWMRDCNLDRVRYWSVDWHRNVFLDVDWVWLGHMHRVRSVYWHGYGHFHRVWNVFLNGNSDWMGYWNGNLFGDGHLLDVMVVVQ